MRTKLRLAAALLLTGLFVQAQTKPTTFSKVYVGADGLAHVVDAKGNDRAMPKEEGQVEVSTPKLSPDKSAAGWLVLQENCCTTYNIPTGLAMYRGRKTRQLGDGLMIYDWCFVGQGEQIAMSTGTVHGMRDRHLLLYDAATGRQLKEWSGGNDDKPPAWAEGLER